MKRYLLTAGLAVLVIGAAAVAPTLRPSPPPAPAAPRVVPGVSPAAEDRAVAELVFVLDTTGSMGGLLEGAKDTIWSVVDDFASQTPRPEVRVGIVAYRDRGDEYVTRSTPLTADLDQVYGVLRGLQAHGGGDTPESVLRGLSEAVAGQPWTPGDRVFRSIFVVGDAPDQGYADEPGRAEVVARARQRDIYVHAIQCGGLAGTQPQFEAIASAGGGVYRAVAQDGAVERLVSPVDDRLAELQRELARTGLPWGSDADRAELRGKLGELEALGAGEASSAAARLSALSKGDKRVVTAAREARGDFLDDLEAGRVALDGVASDALPEPLAALPPAQRRADVARRMAQREAIQTEIDDLVRERAAWLEARRRAAADEARYDREIVGASLDKMRSLGLIR